MRRGEVAGWAVREARHADALPALRPLLLPDESKRLDGVLVRLVPGDPYRGHEHVPVALVHL